MGEVLREFYKKEWEKAGRTGELKLFPERLNKLLAKDFPPQRWVVDDLVPYGGVTVMSGLPGTFKTWLLMEMAHKVAEGQLLFGHFNTSQMGVLIIDEESGERMLNERFKQLKVSGDLPIHYLTRTGYKMKQLYVEAIAKTARELKAGFIIFDSLVRFNDGDENTSKDMAELFDCFKQLADNDFSVLITHHNRKGMGGKSNPALDMRGSSDILASLDCHLAVARSGESEFLKVIQTKNRYMPEVKPFELRFRPLNGQSQFEYVGEAKTMADQHREMLDKIVKIVTDNSDIAHGDLKMLAKDSGVKAGGHKLDDMIQELVAGNEIAMERGVRNSKHYFPVIQVDGSAAKTQ